MNSFSFSSSERIHNSAEFQRVYTKGRRFVTKHFVWFFLKEEEGGRADKRIGITVTKSVGKAVQRNRVKRQIREFFRLNKRSLPAGSLVIKAKNSAAVADNAEIRKDLMSGLRRLNV